MPPLFADDLDHVFAHTRELWEEARGKRFFITGGTGFFGIWLLETFCHINEKLDLGMQATVLTRNAKRFANKCPHLASNSALRFHGGDARSFPFPDGPFFACIHAATEADTQVMASDPLQVFDVNVEGTRRVLEFAHKAGARRFLFTSSGAVYGRQPSDLERIPESYTGGPDPTDTSSAYGIAGEAKRAAESLCAVYARQLGVETVIARCFTFVGPHLPLDGKFAIGNFLRDAMRGAPIQVAGDGTPLRSYLYASDLAIWLWTLLFRGAPGRAYNLGSGEAISIADLARTVAEAVAPSARVSIAQPPPAEGIATPPSRYVPDVGRAELDLNLRQTIPLQEALRRTAAWAAAASIH